MYYHFNVSQPPFEISSLINHGFGDEEILASRGQVTFSSFYCLEVIERKIRAGFPGMQPAQSPKGTPRATAWGLVLCRGCLKTLCNSAFECMFYKLGWMEHFPGAWGHFSVWSSLFLPPAPAPPRMGPPLLLQTCVSSHLPALPLTAAHPLGQPFGPADIHGRSTQRSRVR